MIKNCGIYHESSEKCHCKTGKSKILQTFPVKTCLPWNHKNSGTITGHHDQTILK